MARNTDETPVPGATFTDAQFQALIAALNAPKQQGAVITPDVLKDILKETAPRKRENEMHPGISAFSYPEGDLEKPKPVLPFELYWNAYPVHKFPETQHYRELELACQLQPGEYTVIRKDGSKMGVTVRGERNADGVLTKVHVEFPISREEKALVPPMHVTLYQLVHNENPKKAFVEAMTEHLQMVLA